MPLPVAARRLAYRCAYRGLELYWLLRRPTKLGVKCLLTHRGRILLVRHSYGVRCWDLPGGAIKRREGPLDAARREMFEELSVQAPEWVELGPVQGVFHHRRDTIFCFRAELASPAITIDDGELITASWFDVDDLPPGLGPYVLRILDREGATPTRSSRAAYS